MRGWLMLRSIWLELDSSGVLPSALSTICCTDTCSCGSFVMMTKTVGEYENTTVSVGPTAASVSFTPPNSGATTGSGPALV